MPIHFGTDGWRAVISDTFTYSNLRLVAQAIADAVASDHWDKSGNGGQIPDPSKIVVGFDTRFQNFQAIQLCRTQVSDSSSIFWFFFRN